MLSRHTLAHTHRTYQLKRGAVGANATAISGGEQPLLPLWGQICCNLMAQPECATNSRIAGFINIQVSLLWTAGHQFQILVNSTTETRVDNHSECCAIIDNYSTVPVIGITNIYIIFAHSVWLEVCLNGSDFGV